MDKDGEKQGRAVPETSRGLFLKALNYSVPVLLGYMAIGIAFGLLLVEAGYPWWLAPLMSVVMYAGAGQFIAVGLFAAGAALWEAVLVQLVVNARHLAYGLSLLKGFQKAGPYRYYLIYALSDETFALLSSLPEDEAEGEGGGRGRFMFYVALLDQSYWIAGSAIGAAAGALLPFDFEGISFALTALFVVLLIEQIRRLFTGGTRFPSLRHLAPFIISAPVAVLAVMFLPPRVSLLSALVISLILVRLFDGKFRDA
jgi:4-azaleucine resistance transporter AzlC